MTPVSPLVPLAAPTLHAPAPQEMPMPFPPQKITGRLATRRDPSTGGALIDGNSIMLLAGLNL